MGDMKCEQEVKLSRTSRAGRGLEKRLFQMNSEEGTVPGTVERLTEEV